MPPMNPTPPHQLPSLLSQFTHEHYISAQAAREEAAVQLCDALVAEMAADLRSVCASSSSSSSTNASAAAPQCSAECAAATQRLLAHRCYRGLGDEAATVRYRVLNRAVPGSAARVDGVLAAHAFRDQAQVMQLIDAAHASCVGPGSSCWSALQRRLMTLWVACDVNLLQQPAYAVDTFWQNASHTCDEACAAAAAALLAEPCWPALYAAATTLTVQSTHLLHLDDSTRGEPPRRWLPTREEWIQAPFDSTTEQWFWDQHTEPHMYHYPLSAAAAADDDAAPTMERQWTARDTQYSVAVMLTAVAPHWQTAASQCLYRPVSPAPRQCSEEVWERLARVLAACEDADLTAAAHAQRCPGPCAAAVAALQADAYDDNRAFCYGLLAQLTVPRDPRALKRAEDASLSKGCDTLSVHAQYDELGQPFLFRLFRPTCGCDAACDVRAPPWFPSQLLAVLGSVCVLSGTASGVAHLRALVVLRSSFNMDTRVLVLQHVNIHVDTHMVRAQQRGTGFLGWEQSCQSAT